MGYAVFGEDLLPLDFLSSAGEREILTGSAETDRQRRQMISAYHKETIIKFTIRRFCC